MSGSTADADALNGVATELRNQANRVDTIARNVRGMDPNLPPPPPPPAPTPTIDFVLDSLVVGTRGVVAQISGITHVGYVVYQNNPPDNTARPGSEVRNVAVPAGGELRFNINLVEPGDRLMMFSEPDFAVKAFSDFAIAADPTAPTPPTISRTIDVSLASLELGMREVTAKVTGISQIGYVVFQNNHPYYSWRPGSEIRNVNVPPNGIVKFFVELVAENDRVKVFSEPDLAVFKDSDYAIAVGAAPAPAPAPAPGEPLPNQVGIFLENFDGPWTGQMSHVWGQKEVISVANGFLDIGPTAAGAGVMSHIPSGRDVGFGYGRFHCRAKLTGGKGSGSGPALVAWPSSNAWPGPEIDFAEIDANGELYFAHHHKNANGDDEDQIVRVLGLDWWNFHTYGFLYQRDSVTFEVDGKAVGVITQHIIPDFSEGGENRVLGAMNRSDTTSITVDKIGWTPLATALEQDAAIAVPPPATTAPSIVVTLDSAVVGARTATATIKSITSVGYNVYRSDAAGTVRTGSEVRNVAVPASGVLSVPVTLVDPGDRVRVFSEPTGAVEGSSEPAVAAPVALPSIGPVTLDSLVVGARNFTVKIANLSTVGYTVFQNISPNYPWRSATTVRNAAVPVGGTLTAPITLTDPGDRVKVFSEPDAAIYSDSDMAKSATAPAPAANQAEAIWRKMGLGVNQERFNAVDRHDTGNSAYWHYYLNTLKLKQVRFFYPYEPGHEYFGFSDENYFRRYVERCKVALTSGMPVVHLDCSDVLGMWNMSNAFASTMDAHYEMCGRVIASFGLPVDRFIVGSTNEYGGGTNAEWQPHRIRWNNILRKWLPNHTIVEGPCTWKDCEALFNTGKYDAFVPWSDPNKIFDVHHYYGVSQITGEGWDAGGMLWLAQNMRAFGANHKTPVYSGEYGSGGWYGDQDVSQNPSKWGPRLNELFSQQDTALIRPTLWATTNGEAWRMNNYDTNRIRGDLGEATVIGWANRVNSLTTA